MYSNLFLLLLLGSVMAACHAQYFTEMFDECGGGAEDEGLNSDESGDLFSAASEPGFQYGPERVNKGNVALLHKDTVEMPTELVARLILSASRHSRLHLQPEDLRNSDYVYVDPTLFV